MDTTLRFGGRRERRGWRSGLGGRVGGPARFPGVPGVSWTVGLGGAAVAPPTGSQDEPAAFSLAELFGPIFPLVSFSKHDVQPDSVGDTTLRELKAETDSKVST